MTTLKFVVRAYHVNAPFGPPATEKISDTADHEQIEEVVGRLCRQKIDDMRMRGFNLAAPGFNLRVTLERVE